MESPITAAAGIEKHSESILYPFNLFVSSKANQRYVESHHNIYMGAKDQSPQSCPHRTAVCGRILR